MVSFKNYDSIMITKDIIEGHFISMHDFKSEHKRYYFFPGSKHGYHFWNNKEEYYEYYDINPYELILK